MSPTSGGYGRGQPEDVGTVRVTREPELIQKMWYGSAEEAIEAVQAAATLGFGVSLRNESVAEEDEPTASAEQWVVTILNDVPAAEPETEAADTD